MTCACYHNRAGICAVLGIPASSDHMCQAREPIDLARCMREALAAGPATTSALRVVLGVRDVAAVGAKLRRELSDGTRLTCERAAVGSDYLWRLEES